MSITKHPDVGLPTNPPVVTKDAVFGVGETVTHEWPMGANADCEALYEAFVAQMNSGANIGQVTYKNQQGRGNVVVRYGRTGQDILGEPDTVAMVEEVIAVDVDRDMAENPYFETLTNDQVAEIRRASEEHWSETEITTRSATEELGGGTAWASWTALMKELRNHLTHGNNIWHDTAFIFRRSRFSVQTADTLLTFADINKVATTSPGFKTDMLNLLQSLPAGEWLYRPPTAEFLGRGRWKTTQEWHWAKQWSIVYGGTWHL